MSTQLRKSPLAGTATQRRSKSWGVAVVAVMTALLPAGRCQAAASARAATGSWWYSPVATDTDSVWFGTLNWASTAAINWTSGLNEADFTTSAATVTASEAKFNVPPVGLPTAKVWAPFNDVYNPVPGGGSQATTGGTGSSKVGAVFYGANWSVTAGGTVGLAPIPHPVTGVMGIPDYDARIVGKDPFNIFPEDTALLLEPTYSLYIPMSVVGGQSLPNSAVRTSEYEFSAEYETIDGIHQLLSIHVAGDQATAVIPSSLYSSDVLLFTRTSDDQTPSVGLPGIPTTTGSIEAMLLADLAGDLTIDTPIHLAVVLNNINVPTELLLDGSGAVARTSVSITAHETDIPEPATLTLAVLGCLALWWRRRR